MQPNGRGGGHLCMPPPTTAARIMRRSNTSDDGWCVREVGCDPSREPAIANVLAVANGTIGVRGWLDERGADCGPGTFFAGIFIPSDESISDAHCPLLPPRRAGSRCISHSTANGSIRSTNALAGVPLERMIREASVFAFRKRYRGRRIGSAMA